MKFHKSITGKRVRAMVHDQMFDLENPGICVVCGADADGCEPDARKYECEACGEKAVYGAQELLLMGAGQ